VKTIHSVDALQAEVDTSSGLVLVVFLGNSVDRFGEDELLKELEANYGSRIRFVKVSPEATEVWEEFRIRGKPVYLFFHDGIVIERTLGRLDPQNVALIIATVEQRRE